MSGWTTVTKQRTTPRNVVVAKRTPPSDLSANEATVYAVLKAAHPSALTPEDIFRAQKQGLSLEDIWAALDGAKLKSCCVKGPHVTYTLRAQAKK